MLDPLYADIAWFLFPLLVGAALFLLGLSLHRFPWLLRASVVAVAILIVVAAGLGLFGLLPFEAWAVVSALGGSTMLLSWTAIFLAAMVWRVPRRSFSTPFLVFLVGIGSVLVVLEAGGRLYWRFFGAAVWSNVPDRDGLVQQSSGMTCSPAAAAMLLNRLGVAASEGEMAYLAYTSVFGTDAFAMARALNRKVHDHGLLGRALKTDYQSLLREQRPFIAHIRAQVGGHAILIEKVGPDAVIVCDPAHGVRGQMERAIFEELWDGTIVACEK